MFDASLPPSLHLCAQQVLLQLLSSPTLISSNAQSKMYPSLLRPCCLIPYLKIHLRFTGAGLFFHGHTGGWINCSAGGGRLTSLDCLSYLLHPLGCFPAVMSNNFCNFGVVHSWKLTDDGVSSRCVCMPLAISSFASNLICFVTPTWLISL